jgi:tetratricopeptide (TPR) repeat protein
VVNEHLGDLAGAQQAFRTAFSNAPDHELSMCAYALSLASSGHAGEADTFLTDKRAKKADSPRLTACAAEVKSLQNDHATAQQLGQDALRMDPNFKDAMVTLARDHYRARKMDLAKYALTAVLEGFGDATPARDKENAEAHLLRGLIMRESGSRIVALKDFEAATKKRPDLVEALVNLGSMRLEAGNANDALAPLESATKFGPKSALAHLNLGDTYRLLQRYADAKTEFDKALSLDSSLAAAHYDIGLMYLTAQGIPGTSADQQVSTAIKELETYKTMRGAKAPLGVNDEIDDLLNRAKAKQAELKNTVAAPAGGAAAAPAASGKAAAATPAAAAPAAAAPAKPAAPSPAGKPDAGGGIIRDMP